MHDLLLKAGMRIPRLSSLTMSPAQRQYSSNIKDTIQTPKLQSPDTALAPVTGTVAVSQKRVSLVDSGKPNVLVILRFADNVGSFGRNANIRMG